MLYLHAFATGSVVKSILCIQNNDVALCYILSRVHKNEESRTAHYTNGDNHWESNVTNT